MGGFGTTNRKVELYNPASGNSCPLEDLQEDRSHHTSCGGLICGGDTNFGQQFQSCDKIQGTKISSLPNLKLRQMRVNHLCWSLPDGKTLLLGGSLVAATTTEVISQSSSSDSFELPYRTDMACGIVVGDRYIVTGGVDTGATPGGEWKALDTVANYSQSGQVEYLPSLNQKRFEHACSSYISNSGENVLLVTGGSVVGQSFLESTFLDSTEILESPGKSWKTLETARLPSPRSSLRAGTVNNIVFIFGGDGSDILTSDSNKDILSFNGEKESWHPAGKMIVGRVGHAVEVTEDVSQHCP